MLPRTRRYAFLLLARAAAADASVSFAQTLGSHMVLQHDASRVWGVADVADGAVVNVTVERDDAPTIWAVGAVENGSWVVDLPPQPPTPVSTKNGTVAAAPGAAVTASVGGAAASLDDVVFGEVWLCSGQSNMAFLLENAFDGAAEARRADLFPAIRYATVAKVTADAPQADAPMRQNWSVGSSATISQPDADVADDDWLYNSAVCYLYAQELLLGLNASVAIGVLASDWGGTDIESWSSPAALARCPGSKMTDGSVRYNAMIAPLHAMALRGAIWYQGEANAGAADLYGCQLPALVDDWRGLFGDDFAFGFVSLAGFVSNGTQYPMTRYRMQATTDKALTFSATAYDLGDADSPYGSVHPRYKRDVAERLARGGLGVVYKQAVEWTGPVGASASVVDGALTVHFDGCGAGLEMNAVNSTVFQPSWSGSRVFEVCASDECDPTSVDPTLWTEVDATLLGDCAVSLDAATARSVRFAWRAFPCNHLGCGLYGAQADGVRLPPRPLWLNVSA